ncbi:EAL domain-containing protein [Lysinibacillus endophyticus]|uniref:EAL domain-containing protein n=1 Tax=Ureibacillus endophyticus TaxID=1978490 RepID=UPI0031362D0F
MKIMKQMIDESNIEEIKEQLKKLLDIEYALDKSSIIAITDQTGTINYVNDLFCELSQYSREELMGQNHRILNSGYHSKQFFKDMWKCIGEGNIWSGEIKNKRKDGSLYWVHATIVPFLNEKGKPYQYISIRTDITKEKELEEQVIQSNEKYRLIAENTVNLITLIRENGNIEYASPSFQNVLHYDLKELEQGNLFDLIHHDDLPFLQKDLDFFLEKGQQSLDCEFRLRTIKGNYIFVEAVISKTKHTDGSFKDLILVVMKDITGKKEVEKKIFHLAYHDALTDFPNRRSFMNQLRNELINRHKSKYKMSILSIDLDNFKSINDQVGHDVGDIVLKRAAENIQKAIRPIDIAGRMGGDEFIVMLNKVKDIQETEAIVKRILSNFNEAINIEGQDYFVTCSIGVANYPEHGDSPEELIKNADNALAHVKSGSKNDFLIFNKTIENQSIERRLLESAMRTAIKENQFYLEYQPKVNLQTNKIIGMEALVRWHHPDLGTISPGKFIPLAEETGLIVPLGEWILKESCKQTKKWHDIGYTDITVSVNVSVRQLEDPLFIDKVKNVLMETKLNPEWLEIEVTESILADVENIVKILREIRLLGIQISLDDFGTGYSSLSYIKNLPIDILKIDQSFVKDIHQNEESSAIVQAILKIADSIGLQVIAEGIELQDHVLKLSKDGCRFGQGYFFSRPLKVDAFEQFMDRLLVTI